MVCEFPAMQAVHCGLRALRVAEGKEEDAYGDRKERDWDEDKPVRVQVNNEFGTVNDESDPDNFAVLNEKCLKNGDGGAVQVEFSCPCWKGAWFQPLNLSQVMRKWFFLNLDFKCNLLVPLQNVDKSGKFFVTHDTTASVDSTVKGQCVTVRRGGGHARTSNPDFC